MRCPACGARNTAAAAWCTQCYLALEPAAADPPAAPPEPSVSPVPPAADGPPAVPPVPPAVAGAVADRPADSSDAPDAPAGPDAERDVRVRDEVVEWRCHQCASWTPLLLARCQACGTPRSGFVPDEAAVTTVVVRPVAVVAGAVLPGLGHLVAGARGAGWARILLMVLWGGGAVALGRGEGPVAPAVLLVLAAVGLWAVSLVDLLRLGAGQPPVLSARRMAWTVVVVTLVLVLSALAGAPAGPDS